MGLSGYGAVDTGFLPLWLLQDFLFTMTRKSVSPLWPLLSSWYLGCPGHVVGCAGVAPEWGTA